MAGPAPTEILKYTEDHDKKLQEEVASNSTEAGHPTDSKSVNPDDQSALKNIRDAIVEISHEVGHDATHVVTTVAGDETAKIRIAKEKVPTSIAAGRWFKKNLLNRKAA